MTRMAGSGQSEEAVPLFDLANDVSLTHADPQMLRIERVGKKMFGVAHCVIALGRTVPFSSGDVHPAISREREFCYSVSLSDEAVVVADTRTHLSLRQHPCVAGAPHIRFYASQPVYDHDKRLVGTLSLLDYTPRQGLDHGELHMLADLAGLVERELEFRSVNALQRDLQKKNKNLRRKSLVDPLIGTWNRGAIMRILAIESVRCDKAGMPLSLIVADLDYFKRINDTYGHPAGDTVLVKVASRLRSCIRPQEALGRYGGEEFLIVLPGASCETAMSVAERMRMTVASQPEVIGDTSLSLTISAGIASTDMFPNATTEELISRADMALYMAKDAGRNRVVNATPDLF